MDHFAGLDVSVKETSVCIVDDTGKIVREVKVASEPEALLAVLKNPAYRIDARLSSGGAKRLYKPGGFLQILCVAAFREPAVDRCQEFERVIGFAAARQQLRERGRATELP